MKQTENYSFINQFWETAILPTLIEYIKIPCKSPAYDKDWYRNGYMQQAIQLITEWCLQHALSDMKLEVIALENKTPIILIDIPSSDKNSTDTVLLYGHLDKQPELSGWDSDLGPWQPVLRGDHLYGRGSADDGYAVFAALTALKALQQQSLPHARAVILIEACEESGSADLPFYIEKLSDSIGKPSLIICLDSGCGNYNQLWVTTSLRGLIDGVLKIDVLKDGIHSGIGSGVVPSTFRILRQLLDRIEDKETGDVVIPQLKVVIPEERKSQMQQTAAILSHDFVSDYPLLPNVSPESSSVYELIERSTWRAALSVTGVDGFPAIENAGNVTLPTIAAKLSIRLPPTCNEKDIANKLKNILEQDPPYQAQITFTNPTFAPGWNAPATAAWLAKAMNAASLAYFGHPAAYMGEGGSIPFMGMLGEKFPEAQFMIIGVLGPQSNAHGPNEFLHIPMAKKLTACIADVIVAHYQRNTP